MAAQTDPSAPYTVHLDADAARELAQGGGALLLLGIPPGTVFGIDQQAFIVGPKFKGVKMLPPGPHFISYRAVSHEGGVSPTSSFFVTVKPKDVLVMQWDAATEAIVPIEDEEESGRYAAGVRRFDFDAFLAPYNLSAYRQWLNLSMHVTPDIISRIAPVGNVISIMAEADDPELMEPKTAAEHKLVDHLREGRAKLAQLLQKREAGAAGAAAEPAAQATLAPEPASMQQQQNMDVDINATEQAQQAADSASERGPSHEEAPSSSGRCFYTPLPWLVKQRGATAAELTAWNMDKSKLLMQVLSERYGGSFTGLLGELQFAFIAFVYGQSLDGYAQWKALIVMLLSCEEAVMQENLQKEFVKALHAIKRQLEASMGSSSSGSGSSGPGGSGEGGAGAPGGDEGPSQAPMPFGVSMVEELFPDSFLRRMFGSFFRMLQERQSDVGPELFREASSLKALLRRTLGWEFDAELVGDRGGAGLGHILAGGDEDDEDGPVVVEDVEDLIRL